MIVTHRASLSNRDQRTIDIMAKIKNAEALKNVTPVSAGPSIVERAAPNVDTSREADPLERRSWEEIPLFRHNEDGSFTPLSSVYKVGSLDTREEHRQAWLFYFSNPYKLPSRSGNRTLDIARLPPGVSFFRHRYCDGTLEQVKDMTAIEDTREALKFYDHIQTLPVFQAVNGRMAYVHDTRSRNIVMRCFMQHNGYPEGFYWSKVVPVSTDNLHKPVVAQTRSAAPRDEFDI